MYIVYNGQDQVFFITLFVAYMGGGYWHANTICTTASFQEEGEKGVETCNKLVKWVIAY